MTTDAPLPPPPPVTMVAHGDRARAVAADALGHLQGTMAAAGAPPESPGPVVAIVVGGAWTAPDLAEMSGPDRAWLVVLGPTIEDVADLDDVLDADDAPEVDAVLLLRDDAGAALALEAWIRLRHDAPSRAFADLRDARGRARRFASAAAMVPPAAPPDASAARADGGQAAAARVRDARAEASQAGSAAAHDVALAVAQSPAGSAAEAVARARTTSVDVSGIAATALAAVPVEPAALAAAAAAAQVPAAPVAGEDAAAMAVVAADSALAAELARTGLAARVGRRKRVAELDQGRADAITAWATLLAQMHGQAAEVEAATLIGSECATRLPEAQERQRERADDQQREAQGRWWRDTVAKVESLRPPIAVAADAAGTSWGGATPVVRRHLLLAEPPTGADLLAQAGDAAGVVLHETEIDRPLAAAIIMGLSAPGVQLD